MNFINESQKKVALKIEHFLNNVLNEINNFSSKVLIKEMNKRYIEIYEWALNNNIELINIFSDKDKTPKLVSQKQLYYYLFPIKTNVDRNKLQLFNVSVYSVTPPNEAEMISKTIKNLVNMVSNSKLHTRIIITDGTANVVGNTINFSLNFPEVNTVEIDKNVFDALKYNCQDVYKLKNINYYNDDCRNIIPKLKQDVIFIDPPWNGILYKAYEKLELYLGKENIKDVIKFWYHHNYAKLYVIKCPYNYDFEYYITEYKNTYIQKIRNYNIIYLFNV
jgi:predicted RNA methylase